MDHQSALIRMRCVGNATLDDVLHSFPDLASNASLPQEVNVLVDLSELRTLPDPGELRRIISGVNDLQTKFKWGACAIVANSDVLFGMSRMFQAFAEPYFLASSVFRELEEAERWLASVHPPAA